MSPRDLRLASITIPAPDLRPEAFLALAAGSSRGFWARGSRWVAHRGVVAELRSDTEVPGDRFDRVREAARRLASDPLLPPGATRAPRVRFYGGFSFREDHAPQGVWEAFPGGLFHLPEVELEGDGGGDAWLRVRSLARPEDAEETFRRLRHRAEALRAELAGLEARPAGGASPVEGRTGPTDREGWERAVTHCLEAIEAGRVRKVVLARVLDVDVTAGGSGPPRPDPAEVAAALWAANRGSHVFLFEPRPGSVIAGAAPETVATLRDGVFHATAVAGSIRRGDSPREQAELAARLLASEKDRAEQQIALEDMVRRLETIAHQIRTDPQPHVLTLARIQHLETEIRASVPSEVGVLDLLRLLHPTPAVCGLPHQAALEVLAEEETFARGWYAGPVGWFDGEGNGIFAPALRTGVHHAGRWRLFAGAGIVRGSVPSAEWEETEMKFRPMLEALAEAGLRTRRSAGGPREVAEEAVRSSSAAGARRHPSEGTDGAP